MCMNNSMKWFIVTNEKWTSAPILHCTNALHHIAPYLTCTSAFNQIAFATKIYFVAFLLQLLLKKKWSSLHMYANIVQQSHNTNLVKFYKLFSLILCIHFIRALTSIKFLQIWNLQDLSFHLRPCLPTLRKIDPNIWK